jgi:hypothetical protein
LFSANGVEPDALDGLRRHEDVHVDEEEEVVGACGGGPDFERLAAGKTAVRRDGDEAYVCLCCSRSC